MAQKVDFKNKIPNTMYPDVTDVTPQEVVALKEQLVLIDVRRPDEYEGELGHIPNSELLTLDFLPQLLGDIPKDRPVVFICRSGNRSGQAAQFAFENGWSNCFNMQGGMLLWNELKLGTEGKS
jgi:rhodanese-related sulfurtransferase